MKTNLLVLLSFAALSVGATESLSESSLLASPTHTKVTRTNRGIFGYKYVNDDTSSNGDYVLACSQPGHKKCAPTAIIISGGLQENDSDTILNMVDHKILEEGASGTFVYNSQYYITYSFDINNGETNVYIYTEAEANGLGINF
jgi:hypothetical protein